MRLTIPPSLLATLKCFRVNYAETSSDRKMSNSVLLFQLNSEGSNLLDRILNRPDFSDLRADVHLNALKNKIWVLRCRLISLASTMQWYSKLMFTLSSADLFVCVSIDIRINSDSNRRLQSQFTSDSIDPFKFWLTLNVETVYLMFQRDSDLGLRLTNTSKNAIFNV